MTLDVFATGSTTAYNFDVPTNPLMTTQRSSTSYTTGDVLFSAIYSDDSEETVYSEIILNKTLQAEYENLSVTKGYNINCFDTVSSTGVSLATIDAATNSPNINTHYYFVLIHSDDHLKHHFARITEIKTSDTLGDSFDFEPKLGNEIPQGTKFKLYKGPAITSKAVAFSAGIKQDLKASLHVARPHFWFVDSLDKKDELDHNTKYFARVQAEGDGSSVTLNSSTDKVTFVTVTNYGQVVVDYSKYSLSASITDILRTKDAIYESNEGITLASIDDSDYDLFAPNAVRDTDDNIASTGVYITKGPKRYLHYNYSPTKNNSTANIIDLEVEESIGKKSSYAEIKIADSFRILSKKINTYDPLRVHHMIHRGDFNDWVSFGATITSVTSNVVNKPLYAINTPVDLQTYLNDGDEVLINSRVMIVYDVTASTLRFYQESRLETDSAFTTTTSIATIAEDTEIYRRAWNTTDGTLLTGMRMLDSRQDNLYVSLISNEFSQLEAGVTSYIGDTGLLTLSFENKGYDNISALDNMTGQYIIYNEKLNGRITKLSQDKPDGQTIMSISGADKLRELLDPIIEKNTLFSKDIVYSTNSPYNKVTSLGINITTTFGSISAVLSGSVGITIGDKIFAKTASGTMVYLGEAHQTFSYSASTVTNFFKEGALGQVTTGAAYKASTKYTVFNKALSSNSFVSSSTSLYGTANKGLFFESGTKIVAGAETDNLSNSSINTVNPKAVGYYLSEAKNMKSDELFQARLDDNASSKSYSTFDTVNTLIDFNILSIQEIDGNQVIEIAPHIPLTLGRVDINYANTQDTTFTSLGTNTAAITSTETDAKQRFIFTRTTTVLSTAAVPRNFHNKPLYENNIFVGNIILAVLQSDQVNIKIFIDRQLPIVANGSTLSTLAGDGTTNETAKLTHELSLLNGGHLHGGKIITLLSPHRKPVPTRQGFGETVSLDFTLDYNATPHSLTNSDRFGSPYYRIINVEKGNVTFKKPMNTSLFEPVNILYNRPTKIPYYVSAYKFDPAFYIDSVIQNNIIGVNKMDNVLRQHSLIESRGYVPPSGSNFFDTIVHKDGGSAKFTNFHFDPTTHHNTTNTSTDHAEKTPYAVKDLLWQPDPKVARMFLFINSDLSPYSSVRKDSLLNPKLTRDISKYNLFTLTDGLTVNFSDNKNNAGISTKTITYKDSNYSSSSIISSEKTLSSLNRFGMMRLTELCFDWAFNQFDPENPPPKTATLPHFYYYSHDVSSSHIGTLHATQSLNLKLLTFTGNVVVANGDLILDSNGRFIGVCDGASDGTDDNIVLLHENRYNTNGTTHNTTTNGIYKITSTEKALISGVGETDTFTSRLDSIHMHKGVVVNTLANDTDSDAGDGYSREEWLSKFGTHLGVAGSNANKKHNLFNPINIQGDSSLIVNEGGATGNTNMHSSNLLELIDTLDTVSGGSAASGNALFMQYWLPIFLDRYSIEDGTQLVSSGMVGAHIKATTKYNDATGTNVQKYGLIGHSLNGSFANKETFNQSAITGVGLDNLADGAFIGFKPRLHVTGSATDTGKTSSGSTTHIYHFTISGKYKWLQYVDLTGTYIIPGLTNYIDSDGSIESISSSNSETYGLNNSVPPLALPYCISHEVDHSNSTETHILTMSHTLTSSNWHRIMQPNHTCTYAYGPKDIDLNTFSSAYTKMPYADKMYENINNYALNNAKGNRTLQGDNEGVLSMYVILDTESSSSPFYVTSADGISNGVGNTPDEILVPTVYLNKMLNGVSGKFCVSDGDTMFSTPLSFLLRSQGNNVDFGYTGNTLSFGKMQETLGVVSVSEITSITVGGETPINENSKRAMIGSVVNICNETEDIIEELLEEQGTPFAITREDYPLFVAPNFESISLFQAINFLLQKKDKTLIQTEDTFTIKNKESSDFYTNLLISDNGDIRIYEYEVLDSTFDEYNHIIVNGKSHQGTKRDMASIHAIGKKSLKVFERKLNTQEEVDVRATELLILHETNYPSKKIGTENRNKKLRITVGHANISQIRVGDIVEVEIKQENIPRNQYLVLEITHSLTGLMELELGKYRIGMEDRFSELSIDVDTTQTQQNNTSNESNTINLGFLESIKIKPLRLLVRKRTTTGSMTLGFTTALNTGTAQLGFTGGASIVYADLVEEEF